MEILSLAFLKPNESGKVKEILGGESITKRLYELGLYTGSKVTMVKNDIGPVIIYLSGNKLALGRGLAQKVMIEI